MNSPDQPPSWNALVARARDAAPPADIDLRAAIRAEISAQPATRPSHPSLLEDVLAACQARWLRTGFACGLVFAGWTCWQGVDAARELAALWSVAGPLMAQL